MAGLAGTEDGDFVERYERQMQRADNIYADVIAALTAAEVPAFITQTGGMCLAIEFPAPDGDGWFWLCDRDDSLSWDRREDQGWGLGRYSGAEDADGSEGWIETAERKTPQAAVELVLASINRKAAE